MHRYPCHQVTQLPYRTNNSTITSFSSLITCVVNILLAVVSLLSRVFRERCCMGTLCFSPLYLFVWICTCESVIIWEKGEEGETDGSRRGSIQPILWLSHMGMHERQEGRSAEDGEGSLFIQRDSKREKLWRWFPSSLLSHLCVSTMNFAFNASWPSRSATIKSEASAGRLLSGREKHLSDCCL